LRGVKILTALQQKCILLWVSQRIQASIPTAIYTRY
jgi:hypothetical protein